MTAGGSRSVFGHAGGVLRSAAQDVRSSWSVKASLLTLLLIAIGLAPLAVSDSVMVSTLASGLYVVLAAVGLNFVLGLADMPSLGHGAFLGVGAFTTALLRVKADWAFAPATLAGVVVAAVAGALVGAGVVRLRGAALAAATWIVTWLVAFVLGAFPTVFGGSQGLVVPEAEVRLAVVKVDLRITPTIHFEVALILVALSLLAFRALSRSQTGYALTAVRQGRSAAAAIGADSFRLQLGVFTASAAIAGLAGALSVQLAGIADPTSYGPLRSVVLFVAVMLGGAGTVWGPVFGAAALGGIPAAARALGDVAGAPAERFEPLIAGVLLLVALVLGRGGLVRIFSRVLKRHDRSGGDHRAKDGTSETAAEVFAPFEPAPMDAPILQALGLTKTFGGVSALTGVSFTVKGGDIHALIGPNGSGKTTCLRTLAGMMQPEEGDVILSGRPLGASTPRERLQAGLARTLQRTEVFPEMTVLEHALLGAGIHRRFGGPFRTLLSTPRARRESRECVARARKLLDAVGLGWASELPAEKLSSGDQRLLMIAMSCGSSPKVLLLDEPSAGMSREYTERLRSLIERLRDSGVTLILVEHNLRLVGAVANGVTVLSAGRVIAEGRPSEVANDPLVVETYLGSSRF